MQHHDQMHPVRLRSRLGPGAVDHEACYADGCATRWSAQRTLPPGFDEADLLTGEHILGRLVDLARGRA
jgi:hypothetical protein